jgi:manganese/zinc/iron transport system permease protein
VPRVVLTLGAVCLLNLVCILLFYKELKISSFDPALATTLGISARFMHYLLMTLVAITAVASFESVGNILVVAMLIVPAAAAYMLTDRLSVMILLSVIFGIVSAVLGHLSAIAVPPAFGYESTTTAGMMAVASGALFVLAALCGPRHGIITKLIHRARLSAELGARPARDRHEPSPLAESP